MGDDDVVRDTTDFPLRAACVDMGSNAVWFLVAGFSSEDGQPVEVAT